MLYTLSEPFNKMTEQLSKVDSTYIEVVDDGTHTLTKKRVLTLNEIAKSKNIRFSVHAPFADINIASPSKTMLKASMKRLKKSMQYAQDLDTYLWVFHPGSKSGISAFYPGADWQQNLKSIQVLEESATNLGLKIAMENLPEKYNFLMKTPEDFSRFYKETGLENIGIVLDTGHANLEGQIQRFLQNLPKKIEHIHISDNHGETDEHLGLGDGSIDWQEFFKMLNAIGFSGTILTESVFNAEETFQKLKQLFA
jgi:sugar phosphate isomerase/epimerase